MRSGVDEVIRAVPVVALLTLGVPVAGVAARQPFPSRDAANAEYVRASRAAPDDAEILKALETVEADPNLATERTISTLRWKGSDERKRSGLPGWLVWIVGLFSWLERSARFVIWGAAIALIGLLIRYATGLVRRYAPSATDDGFVPPTHVRDLDIRPEMLPDDIGSAARALWDRGDHRAALALLYRGLLSRLTHVHGVPIRDSSTEGDCLALAWNLLPGGRREYVSHLTSIWQRAVYGREEIAAGTVYGLCENFAVSLDRSPLPATERDGAIA